MGRDCAHEGLYLHEFRTFEKDLSTFVVLYRTFPNCVHICSFSVKCSKLVAFSFRNCKRSSLAFVGAAVLTLSGRLGFCGSRSFDFVMNCKISHLACIEMLP